jgi:rare lipoprotein A
VSSLRCAAVKRLISSQVAFAPVCQRASVALFGAALVLALPSCSSEPPPSVGAQASAAKTMKDKTDTHSVAAKPIKTEIGLASYYSRRFDGKETAGGQPFRNDELVAAHRSLPLGTLVRITNLETDSSVELEITDRGPSAQNRREGVIIDVSQAAAAKLGMKKDGRVKVRVDVLKLSKDSHKALSDGTKKHEPPK